MCFRLLLLATASAFAAPSEIPQIGTARQLFLDSHLIERRSGVDFRLHSPELREVVLSPEHPWEGQTLGYPAVVQDGSRYRMYYRASGPPLGTPPKDVSGDQKQMVWDYTAVAESADGIRWTKPALGIVEFRGSSRNNLVWPVKGERGSSLTPFLDTNPGAPPGERYKTLAFINGAYEMIALGSADGLHWKRIHPDPVISYPEDDPLMDSQSLAFWDERQRQYVAYLRGWINFRIRGIRRFTSKDFRRWSKPEFIDLGDTEVEHLYTNNTIPYPRAPEIYLMFAKRFVPGRKLDPQWPYNGLSEVVLLSSRDGLKFDRTFMEPFVRPGPDPLNWHERAIGMGRGILQLSPTELSLYHTEHYRTDQIRVRRATLRPDGFISISAPYRGGEFTTRPFRFEGSELEINFSSSVAGSVRVEVQDPEGRPIPGFRLEDCEEIYGDQLDRLVTWRRGHMELLNSERQEIPHKPSELGRPLRGRAIRLRFVMKSADLFSFRFR